MRNHFPNVILQKMGWCKRLCHMCGKMKIYFTFYFILFFMSNVVVGLTFAEVYQGEFTAVEFTAVGIFTSTQRSNYCTLRSIRIRILIAHCRRNRKEHAQFGIVCRVSPMTPCTANNSCFCFRHSRSIVILKLFAKIIYLLAR